MMLDRPITIIAEIGINHNGDMNLAAEMIRAAKLCRADVAKFQIYIPERILDSETPYIKKHWDTIKATQLSFEDVHFLKDVCDTEGIEFFASVFHPDRVEWTEQLEMERYKIASRSIYDRVLAEAIAATGKPIILSRGWYSFEKGNPALLDYKQAWDRTKQLYCISKYPTPLNELELSSETFRGIYDGFSDHTVGITASVVAMSLGATIIEKHFTMSRELPGCDQSCSIEPSELRQLCDMRDEIEIILSC